MKIEQDKRALEIAALILEKARLEAIRIQKLAAEKKRAYDECMRVKGISGTPTKYFATIEKFVKAYMWPEQLDKYKVALAGSGGLTDQRSLYYKKKAPSGSLMTFD